MKTGLNLTKRVGINHCFEHYSQSSAPLFLFSSWQKGRPWRLEPHIPVRKVITMRRGLFLMFLTVMWV